MIKVEDIFEGTVLHDLDLQDTAAFRELVGDFVETGKLGAVAVEAATKRLDAGDIPAGIAELAVEAGIRVFWSRQLVDELRHLWEAWIKLQKGKTGRKDAQRDREAFRTTIGEVVALCSARGDEILDVGRLLDTYQARLAPLDVFWRLPLVASVLNASERVEMTPRDVAELLPDCVEKVWSKSDPEGRDGLILMIDDLLRAAGVGENVATGPIIEALISDWGFNWERRDKGDNKYIDRRMTPERRAKEFHSRNLQVIRMVRSKHKPKRK